MAVLRCPREQQHAPAHLQHVGGVPGVVVRVPARVALLHAAQEARQRVRLHVDLQGSERHTCQVGHSTFSCRRHTWLDKTRVHRASRLVPPQP